MKKTISTQLTAQNIAAVLQILTATPQQLATLSAPLSAEQLVIPLGEGERSFTEDLAHLINCEARSAEAIYAALLVNEPLFPAIHAERDLGKLLRHDLFAFDELLTYFKFRRMVLLGVLKGLTEAQWGRVIREEDKQRKESVYWRARGLATHEQEHLSDLAQKLSSK